MTWVKEIAIDLALVLAVVTIAHMILLALGWT